MESIQLKKKLNPKGYILINYNGEYILYHRYLMSLYLGRELKSEEKVHHIDFNKLNNNINNLVLFPATKEHSHWHRQYKQFGNTQPLRKRILRLKQAMELERAKNIIEVTI